MAAFTEGFTDTTGGQPGHLGSLISKAIAARRFAQDERRLAEEKAKKAGYDSLEEIGVEKGYFFKAALKSKFGGSYLTGKKQDISAAVDRVKLLKNPKAQFWNFVDNRDSEGKEIKKLNEVERFRDQFDNYAFVSAKRPPEKEVKAETPVVPKKVSPFEMAQSQKAVTKEKMFAKTEEKTAKAASGPGGGGGSRVSREDILTAVTAIAESLEKTAQSINNTIGETKVIAEGVQAIKTDVVTQLSERTDSIENKLDAIVAAINAQTNLQKKMTDDAETTKSMASAKDQGDAADSGDFDDLTTDIDESADDKLGDDLDLGDIPSPAATSAQDIEFQQQDAYQEREAGGIVSGPDEGYLAKLHGDEMVIPIDNNYTQGQPSAMDGKVRPVPQTKAFNEGSYEVGTPSQPSTGSSLGGKVGFTNLDLGMGSKSSSVADSMAQPLMDAMSLPMMVAGGTILSSVNQMMTQLGPENSDVAGEIAKVARPIADVFGLPNNLVNKASGGMKSEDGGDGDKDSKDKTDKKKKGFFGNLFDKLKKIASGNNGASSSSHGGGTVTGDASGSMAKGAEMIEAAGVPEAGAAMLAGNIQQESGWNGQRDWGQVMGDGTSRNGGLVSWASWSDDPARLGKIEKYLGKSITEASDQEQIKAMLWEMENDYPAAYKTFMDPNATTEELKQASYDYWRYGEVGSRFGYAEQALKHLKEGESLLNKESPDGDIESDAATDVPGQPNSAPEITENYGIPPGKSFNFSIPGKGNYKAFKTATGFEIFKFGGIGALVGNDTRIETRDGKNAWAVKALIKAGEERVAASKLKPPESSNPDAKSTSVAASAQQAALKPAEKKTNQGSTSGVTTLNSGAQQRSTETSARPDSRTAVVSPGSDNSLTDAYNPTPVTSD